ncbi:MAG: hypothetical protein ABMA00_19980 [Gemmatimonas sp.]
MAMLPSRPGLHAALAALLSLSVGCASSARDTDALAAHITALADSVFATVPLWALRRVVERWTP